MNPVIKISKTKSFLKKVLRNKKFNPEIVIITGSGLGGIRKKFEIIKTVKYEKIPFFAKATVSGHKGELVFCSYKGKDIIIVSGRVHYYEGHNAGEIIYPLRVLKALGVKTLISTAAVGALNKNYNPGDIVFIKDHINFTGNNPLIGGHFDEFGKRFPDIGSAYDAELRKFALKAAKQNKIKSREGIYFCVSGPSYETPAEVSAFRKLGGDVVGMSVVYEVIAAAQMGIKTLGISYVSNMAAGINKEALSHDDVLVLGKKAGAEISVIIEGVLGKIK
ncbi:MAG: purine-nucleoside phosphorylase [Endomicrobia bacterium]|nr:purine-nucleoside phosphorylase [Endomicrobiia bacterium]MCL2507082.1 purine-nucleoside phosphorylase [Endomicrobiia bacterium]